MKPLTIVCLLTLAALLPALAGDLTCDGCGRKIAGNYVKTNQGKVYCSQECFEKSLPKCAVCGKPIKGRYYPHEGKNYCSEKCLSTLFPECELCGKKVKSWARINDHVFCKECAARPKCFECGLPLAKGIKFDDGRHVCHRCQNDLVSKEEDLRRVFLQGREILATITGEKTPDVPEFQPADLKRMLKLNQMEDQGESNPRLRGFYHRTEQEFLRREPGREDAVRTDVKKTIYLLSGMTRANALVTSIHENTHDLMAEHYPDTLKAPPWVQEGLAQYTASIYARQQKWALQVQSIEKHPDPAYGSGYRYFQKTFGDDNWAGVAKWLKATDVTELPKTCPVK